MHLASVLYALLILNVQSVKIYLVSIVSQERFIVKPSFQISEVNQQSSEAGTPVKKGRPVSGKRFGLPGAFSGQYAESEPFADLYQPGYIRTNQTLPAAYRAGQTEGIFAKYTNDASGNGVILSSLSF